jgi:hypothetical protein
LFRHQSRPVFYGLGHFVFDLSDLPRRIAGDDAAGRVRDHRPRGVTRRPVTSDPAGNDGGIN